MKRRLATAVTSLLAAAAIVGGSVVLIGLILGYRPVVITSGSMAPSAPVGAVVIAHPADPSTVAIDDVLVMRSDGRPTVSHRVVDLQRSPSGHPLAVTRGDANPSVDPIPHQVSERDLVGRWVVPHIGRVLMVARSPLLVLLVVVTAVLVSAGLALRRIWSSSSGLVAGRVMGLMIIGITIVTSGVASALYGSSGAVGANLFTTADCYDGQPAGVQSGSLTMPTDGTINVPITSVDTSQSFLLFSTRSSGNRPANSQVRGQLATATTIEFHRLSGSPTPLPIVIEWSLVTYSCGVEVQRGVVSGPGGSSIDVPLTAVDPTTTFVTASQSTNPVNGTTGADDFVISELTGPTNLRIRAAATASIDADQTIAWQVVSFTAPGDAAVQRVGTTLSAGTGVVDLALATPVDPASTFVIGSMASPSSGSDIGERLVRVELLDSTTVRVERVVTTDEVEVDVQIVELGDGTTVQSGVIQLDPAESTGSITISAVDIARSTATSTVSGPGGLSHGATDQVADDILGEAAVTVRLDDPTTVTITRAATASTARFTWQVITWGGPNWADPQALFRQRIDVTAGAVDAPNGYTTPVTFDHRAMVDAGLATASGDDLRLWRFDGTAWTELDRVRDEGSGWNQTNTTIWFRTTAAIPSAATDTYWLYLGNDAAPLLDDPANVWLIDEPFDGSTLGVFEDRTGGTNWYGADPWTRRMVISIDASTVSTTLTDEVVLVDVTDADLAANAQSDGADLRFTAADGTTPLPHRIEAWNAGTGQIRAWVRVPSIDALSSTDIHLYYGAANAPRQDRPRLVWPGELAVWSNSDGVDPALDDASTNNRDGIDGGTALVSSPLTLPSGPLTIAASFDRSSIGGVDPLLVSQGDPTTTGVFDLGLDTTTSPGNTLGRFRGRFSGSVITLTTPPLPSGRQQLVVIIDASTVTLSVDGVAVDSAALSGATLDRIERSVDVHPDGEQVRLSSGAWSTARLGFAAANFADPGTVAAPGTPSGGSWFGQGPWIERRPVMIRPELTDGTLAGYPVRIQITDPGLAAGTQTDGDDFVFVDADGVTRLDHRIGSWNPGTGQLTAWVRVPTIDPASGASIFLYSDNPAAVDQSDPISLWGENAELVLNN